MSTPRNASAVARYLADRNAAERPKSIDSGTERRAESEAVFHFPFQLGSSDDVYPAGRYALELTDEAHVGASHTAYVRTSTVLIVPTNAGTRHVQIDPRDLDLALKMDAERQLEGGQSENPDSGLAEDSR